MLLFAAAAAGCGAGDGIHKQVLSAPTAAPEMTESGAVSSVPTAAAQPAVSEQSPAKSEPTAETVPQNTAENSSSTAAEIKVYLNGNRLVLETPAQMADGKVMVPIAEITSYFSRSIKASAEDNKLTLTDEKKSNTIVITADSSKAQINGTDTEMSAPAMLNDKGVMLVELSAFRLLFDADNKFNQDYNAAYITESGLC